MFVALATGTVERKLPRFPPFHHILSCVSQLPCYDHLASSLPDPVYRQYLPPSFVHQHSFRQPQLLNLPEHRPLNAGYILLHRLFPVVQRFSCSTSLHLLRRALKLAPPWPIWTPTTLTSAPTKVLTALPRVTVRILLHHIPRASETKLFLQTLSRGLWCTVVCSLFLSLTRRRRDRDCSSADMLPVDERDYPPRERSRSPGPDRDRDGDIRVRDEPQNGRADRFVHTCRDLTIGTADNSAVAHHARVATTMTSPARLTQDPTSSSPVSTRD